MSTRYTLGKSVLRLFDSEADAVVFSGRFRGERWDAIEFACGWLLRGVIGNFHDAAGPIPPAIAEEIAESIGQETNFVPK